MPKNPKSNTEYSVEMTDEAYFALVALPSDRIFDHVVHDLDLLSHSPFLGHIYDPAFEANLPPIECRELFCEQYAIYYYINEAEAMIYVLAIEDQRRDPQQKLERFDYYLFNGSQISGLDG